MRINHVVVATDESPAGWRAVEAALAVARSAAAKTTVLRVVPVGEEPVTPAVDPARAGGVRVDTALVFGAPGIEICRFAEAHGGDLLVVGRKPRSQVSRLLLGDTADAVARRSRIPCLFVPPSVRRLGRVLAAVDGTTRGMAVLRTASDFVRSTGGSLRLVTVEADLGEPAHLASTLRTSRSERLVSFARDRLPAVGAAEEGWRAAGTPFEQVEVRRGDPVEQILAAICEGDTDLLVIGYHRGGPPGLPEVGNAARRLAHVAPCAVLTVPL
jgi:nucleotide-binding universal stress UspA family protein